MARQVRTRNVSAAQARSYLSKAEEYLAAAENELQAKRPIAATSLAIHAAINAADAVCGVRFGKRAAGQDHDLAGELLKEAGRGGAELGTDLRRLLPMKTKAEYDPGAYGSRQHPRLSDAPKDVSPSPDASCPLCRASTGRTSLSPCAGTRYRHLRILPSLSCAADRAKTASRVG